MLKHGGPEIARAALIVVNAQNDFMHPDGAFTHVAREQPESKIDMPFLMGTITHVKRLVAAFRDAGRLDGHHGHPGRYHPVAAHSRLTAQRKFHEH